MKNMRASIQGLLLSALLSVGTVACADTPASPADQAAMAPDVLVTWGDKKITVEDFDAAMQRVRPNDRAEFRRQMKRITAMLEDLLVYRALSAEARASGLDKDPLFQKRVELLVEEALAKERLTAYRKTIVAPDLGVAAEEYYKLHPEEFKVKSQVRAGHVLVSVGKDNRTDAEALERAKLVRGKLIAGEKLNEVAVAFTDDPSVRGNNGDLGYFGRGRMVKEFEDAAFALKNIGDVSDVVKTQFGYHVIVLLGREEERQKPYVEVKDAILSRLNTEFVQRELESYISKIRADKSIKLNTKAIDALQTRLIPGTATMK